ncbi:MAG TPA: urease accessory protein UreD [Bauldia sp.]|nr:urease accessory protein UreD [Bauldia sp.]
MASALHEAVRLEMIAGAMNVVQAVGLPRPLHSTRLERAVGSARVSVRAGDASTGRRNRLAELFQSGAAKIRLPRVGPADPVEAVLLNTAGGLTGGDRLAFAVSVEEGAACTATTQAAERIYRRVTGFAEVETTLSVAAGARLDWIPQETIVFNRSGLARRLEADVDPSASLLAVESVVLGRAAMGETVDRTFVRDAWRIRRGGRLVFADTARIDGDAAGLMAGPATGGPATAFATLLLVAPDAEEQLDRARAALADVPVEAGASAWNGILVARMLAAGGQPLRAALVRLIESLRGVPMPRVWSC